MLNPEIPKSELDEKGVLRDILVELDDGTTVDVEMQAGIERNLIVRKGRSTVTATFT